MTKAASGVSRAAQDRLAGTEAVRSALARLGETASWGILFASAGRDLAEVQSAATEAAGGIPIIGCTTAGEITELGPLTGSVAVLLCSTDGEVAMTFAERTSADSRLAVNQLCKDIFDPRRSARHRRHAISLLLTDGLSGVGEKLVTGVHDQLGGTMAGGAAADNGAFKATYVGAGKRAGTDAAAMLHIGARRPWGIGVDHGLTPTTKPMRVTDATANIVHKIDGGPAFEAYKRHAAARGIDLRPESAATYMIENELGIHFFDKIVRARAPLSVTADGALVCAAEVPKGSMVSILDGEPEAMIRAARSAAEEAKTHLEGQEACGVLLFDCICRGMILKDALAKEVDAVRSVFGDVPVAGFLTYGEIARYTGRLDGWHNATAVVVAIPK